MSPRKTLQGLALLNSSPLSPRASGVDCGDAVKLLLSPQSPSEGRISAHAHGMNHLAGLHGSGVHGGVIGGHSTVAAAADGPVHGSGQTQSGQAAAEAEDAGEHAQVSRITLPRLRALLSAVSLLTATASHGVLAGSWC